ncbi:MAG: hypothetical protein HGB10_09215 [Coriobacteriia bacterium]|nr:hypothetical protein [Coriobacteriia bacterium]
MSDLPTHLRSVDELSPEDREEFERALDSGVSELPPNHPKGILGEKGADLRQVESYEPDLNAGLLQENDWGVRWLSILLGFLIFFPVGYVLLWISPRIPLRIKLVVSAAVAVVLTLLFLVIPRV